VFTHGPQRAARIGFVGGLPFAVGAFATASALFGSHVTGQFRVVDAGPLGPVGAALGTLLASTIVARELARYWTSSVVCGARYALLAHGLGVAFAAVLNAVTRGVGPDALGVVVNAYLSTLVAAALPLALSAAVWVGLYRGWLRTEPPPVQAGDAEVRALRQVQGHELAPFSRPPDRKR